MKRVIYIFIFLLTAGCGSTGQIEKLDLDSIQDLPPEMAIEALEQYSKSFETKDKAWLSSCTYTGDGVKNKNGGELVPYGSICFRPGVGSKTREPHIFMLQSNSKAPICDSLAVHSPIGLIPPNAYEQSVINQRFEFLGSALMSLGAEYCPE